MPRSEDFSLMVEPHIHRGFNLLPWLAIQAIFQIRRNSHRVFDHSALRGIVGRFDNCETTR